MAQTTEESLSMAAESAREQLWADSFQLARRALNFRMRRKAPAAQRVRRSEQWASMMLSPL
jgi:hypothetical protein